MDIVIWVLLLANENEEESMIAKVDEWVKKLEIQTNFAFTEPHAAFPGFIQ